MKKIHYKFFWLSLLILFTAVFMPVNGKGGGPSFDKIAHVLVFAFVSMNASYYFLDTRKKFIKVMALVCTLPFLTEYFQTFIPGRNYENLDIVADVLGLGLGIVLALVFRKLIIFVYTTLGDPRPEA